MNVALLEKVIGHIREEPRRLEMGHWFKTLEEYEKEDPPPCGTIGCIAGWSIVLSGGRTNLFGYEWQEKATTLLDLSEEEADKLFFTDWWPSDFETRYNYAETPQEKADITIERIRHFINTGD